MIDQGARFSVIVARMASTDDDDRDLLDAWRGGQRDAGRALVERHYRAIFRFFHSKVAPALAEDLTQQTFEVLCRGRDNFRAEGTFRAYLFGVARFVLIGWSRRARPFEPAEDSMILDPAQESFAGRLAAEESVRLMATALRSLPLDDQILIELKHWEDLTQAELAGLFAVPQPTVARRLQRARERLRAAIERLTADPALRADPLRNLDSCLLSIRGEIDARWPRKAEP